MKKSSLFLIVTLFIASITLLSFAGNKDATLSKASKIKTIVVDAGHGFKGSLTSRDGTIGTEITEDEVSYEVAKKLVAEIKKQMPDVKVVETRPTPYFVGLRERAEFANANKGDLFISLHCNSAPRLREVRREGSRIETYTVTVGKGKKKKKVKKTREVPVYKTYYHPNPAHGTETYVFAANKTDDKEEILMENGDIFQNEKDDSTLNVNYSNDPVAKQQAALWTKQFFANSVKLASFVEEDFVGIGRFSRGVKQRKVGIWVLQATAMPSILIELGFLTHRPEEEFLMSQEGQQTMAESIGRSIKQYKDAVEKGGGVQNINGNKK